VNGFTFYRRLGLRPVIRIVVYAVAMIDSAVSCSAQQVTVTVPGTSQIGLAGAVAGTTNPAGDTAPLNSPVQANIPITAGQAIQTTASGLVGTGGSTPNLGPVGGPSTDTTYQPTTGTGIAQITGPRSGLIGVFIGNTLNFQTVPPQVDYSGGAQDIRVVYPLLQQPFFVGSGITSEGFSRAWIAPAGSTRLYLGILDAATARNTGSFNATVLLIPQPPGPTNQVRVSGVAQIGLAGAVAGITNPAGDTAPLNAPVAPNVTIAAGEAVQISGVGLVGTGGSTPNLGPDGSTSTDTTYQPTTGTGIAQITGPRSGLVGVFIGNSLNFQNVPPSVDYSGGARDIPVVTPMLQQPFFIGSGVTSDGLTRTWIAPSGSTRLYIGVLDAATARNTGSFTATVSLVPQPDIPTNPVRVSSVAQIGLAGAVTGTTNPAGDTAPLNSPSVVDVPLIAGQALIFTAWGTVGYSGSTPNLGPDGGASTDTTYQPTTGIGIAQITGPRSALVGVFTGDTLVLQNTPPSVDYSSQAARDVSNLTPLLQQPFFVGSGTTSTGNARRVIVPNRATHLYLGVIDAAAARNRGAYIAAVSPDAADTPTVSNSGVVNAAGYGPNPLAPGSISALFGGNLATATQSAAAVPLPNSVAGTRAYFDLTSAPLFFVSSGQINLQVPFELNVQQTHLTISRNGSAGIPLVLNLSPYAPGIFIGGDGSPAIVDYRTGALISATQPVKRGDVLIVYATGLGPIFSPPASGTVTPVDKLYTLVAPVTVAFGSATATADFAGLAPGLVGVYQVNVTVPVLSAGQTTLQLRVGGAASNSVPVYATQ